MSIFKGAGVAIVTPMKENEEVNYEKLQELIEWQIDQSSSRICKTPCTGCGWFRFELHKRSYLSDTGSRGSRSGRNPCSDTLL